MKYTGYLYFWPIILFVPPAIYFLHEGLQYLLITGQTTGIISSNSECPALIFPIHNGQYIATTTAVANLQRLNISNYIQQLILIKLLPSPGHHIRAGFLILISRNWWEMRREMKSSCSGWFSSQVTTRDQLGPRAGQEEPSLADLRLRGGEGGGLRGQRSGYQIKFQASTAKTDLRPVSWEIFSSRALLFSIQVLSEAKVLRRVNRGVR